MAMQFYQDARKAAQKEFRSSVVHGEYPYPLVLDDFVPDDHLNRGRDMGTTHIPMEYVVGTRTSGRTNAFARNFMPLMKENTEFSRKWEALCESQMEEGIREPIKVYEFMNRYYVQEGNKRVSVLKFCGADTVYAHVVRVMPEQNGSREVELYNELVEFQRYSRVNYIEFTKPGSCARLQQLMGKGEKEYWTEEEQRDFSSAQYHFRKAYEANGGKKLTSTLGDALLAFIEIYSYPTLLCSTEDQIKEMLAKVWEDITLQQEEVPFDLKLDPEEVKPGLLSKMFSSGEKKVRKVAFVHDGDPALSPWAHSHEMGRKYVQHVFGDMIETASYSNAMGNDPDAVLEQVVAEGNTIIFTTSSRLQAAALRCAVEHPEITILNCTQITSHRYIRSYHVRMYEAKFVLGAIAGALAGSDDIGYIGYLSYDTEDKQRVSVHMAAQIAGVNAFALGAEMVNPRAKVYLEWYGREHPHDAVKRLTDRGIRLISSQDIPNPDTDCAGSFGLSLISEGNQVSLAAPVWKWGHYYERLLRSIMNKSFQTEYEESGKALNYYWGMSADVVEVACSDKLPASTQNLAELMQANIRAGLSHPFKGKIFTQNNQELDGDLDMGQIMTMDWLAENIVGTIPAYQQDK